MIKQKSALLPLDQVPEFETTDAITAYWRSLLETFIAANCDSFGLSGISSSADTKRIACFNDSQPAAKDEVVVRSEWDTPAAGRRWQDERITRFSIDTEIVSRLARPQFHYWFVTSDIYPADRLYFFGGPQLLVEAEPNELTILFYDLTAARYELMRSVHPAVASYLDFSRNWVATTLSVLALDLNT